MAEMKQSQPPLMSEAKQHQSPARLFRCGVCTADFPSLSTCIAHMKNHAAEPESFSQVEPLATSTVQLRATPLSPSTGKSSFNTEKHFLAAGIPLGLQNPADPSENPSAGIGQTSLATVGGLMPKVASLLTTAGCPNTTSPAMSVLAQNPSPALPNFANIQKTSANCQKYVIASQSSQALAQQNLTTVQQNLTVTHPNQASAQQSLTAVQQNLTATHPAVQENLARTAQQNQVTAQQSLIIAQQSCAAVQKFPSEVTVVPDTSQEAVSISGTPDDAILSHGGGKSPSNIVANTAMISKPLAGKQVINTSIPVEIVVDRKNYKLVSFPTNSSCGPAGSNSASSLLTPGIAVSDTASATCTPQPSNTAAAAACSTELSRVASTTALTQTLGTLNMPQSSLVKLKAAEVSMNSSSTAVASTYSAAVTAANALTSQSTMISVTIPTTATTSTSTTAGLSTLASKRKNILVHDDHFGAVNVKAETLANVVDLAVPSAIPGTFLTKVRKVVCDSEPETRATQQWSQQGQVHGTVVVDSETGTSSNAGAAPTVVKSEVNLKNWASRERDKPYVCPVADCGARYRFLSSLSVHRKRHAGVRPYQCKVCSKRFWHPTNLRVHERVHSKVRLYQCNECGHGFNQANDLRIHMRIHTGELPLKCPVKDCTRAFRDPACFRRHMSKHAGVQPHLKCDSCSARFYHLSALNRHHRKHTGEKDYVCPTCGSAFARADTLKLHQRGHSGHKPYMCSACHMLFADRSYCRRHVAKHLAEEKASVVVVTTTDQPFLIKQEPMEVGDRENEAGAAVGTGEKAETIHLLPPPPQQPTDSASKKQQKGPTVVPLRIPNPPGSDIPYASVEIEIPESDLAGDGNEDEERGGDENEDIVYQYGDMLITISRSAVKELEGGVGEVVEAKADSVAEWLQGQELVSVDPSAATAPFYDQQVEHQYSRGIDAEGVHNGTAQPLTNSSSVVVTVAAGAGGEGPYQQEQQQPLSEYNQIVSSLIKTEPAEPGKDAVVRGVTMTRERQKMPRVGERRWPCPDCDASYFHQAELKRHRTKHTGEMPYQCNVCHKRIRDPSNLKRHLRTHTGDRPYRCQVCHKHFSQAGHLTAHFRIHTGERPYKCEQCPSTFIEANHLRYHKKMHAGIKEFKCSQCDLSFIRNAELKRHVKVHGGDRPFQCELCPANYFRLDALKLHCTIKHRQSQQKPFQCPSCPLSFTKQAYLHRHMQRANHLHNTTTTWDEKNGCWIKEEVEEEEGGGKTPAPDHNSVVADAENNVAANALCELATGVRSAALINVSGSSVVSSSTLLEKDVKSAQGSPLTTKARELARALAAKNRIKQASHRENTTLMMEEEELSAEGNNDEIFVQKVMVEGGSVLGARAVLVASDHAIEVIGDNSDATYHTLDDDSTVSQGAGSVGKTTFMVDTATGKTLGVVETMPEMKFIGEGSKVIGDGLKVIGEEFKIVGEKIVGDGSRVAGEEMGNSRNRVSSYIMVGSEPQLVTENSISSRSSSGRVLTQHDTAGQPPVSTIHVSSGVINTSPTTTFTATSGSARYIHVAQGLAVNADDTYSSPPTKPPGSMLQTSCGLGTGKNPTPMQNHLILDSPIQKQNPSVAPGQVLHADQDISDSEHALMVPDSFKQIPNSMQKVPISETPSPRKNLSIPNVSRQTLNSKQTVPVLQNSNLSQPVQSLVETSGQTPDCKKTLTVLQTPVSRPTETETSRKTSSYHAKSNKKTLSDSTVVVGKVKAAEAGSGKTGRNDGQTRTKKTKVEPVVEKDKGRGAAVSLVTPSGPLRTRSGRERKIKVKYSA